MEKVLILGCAGTGKSTLARALGQKLDLPIHHLDRIYWKEGWEPIEDSEFKAEQSRIVSESRWIIDGNYRSTMDIRLKEADTIIFFDMPRYLCLFRVVRRRIQYHGKTRPDVTEGCTEKIDWEFLQWIWNFNRQNRPAIMEMIREHAPGKRVVIIKKTSESAGFVDSVEKQ